MSTEVIRGGVERAPPPSSAAEPTVRGIRFTSHSYQNMNRMNCDDTLRDGIFTIGRIVVIELTFKLD